MKKIALLLSLVLFIGLMVPFAVSADETSDTTDLYMNIKNASFEEGTTSWGRQGNTKITDKYAHTGKYSVDLSNSTGGTDAQASQTIVGLVKGATYEISAWVLAPSVANTVDFGFWMVFSSLNYYDSKDVTTQVGIDKSIRGGITQSNEWVRYSGEFTPPDTAKSIFLTLRNRTHPCEFYLDDLEIRMVKTPEPIDANTDETFYYTEWETGVLEGETLFLPDAANASATISLVTPAGEETHTETIKDLSNGVKYVFRTEWMEEKGKRYHVRLKVYDKAGAELQNQDFPVFRFDRPTYLGADGVFRKNGKEINFVGGSYGTTEIVNKHPEKGGVTVIQLIGTESISREERMNQALDQGMFVLFNLYSDGKSAGHPDRIESVKETVKKWKDHPALFGWKIQDEPYQRGNTDEELIAAYEAIRNIDPDHPIYFPDSPPGGYEWCFRYCDIFDIDTYIGSEADAGRKFTEYFDIAMKASKGRKPFSIVLQFFEYLGYMPTLDELRHHTYQAFFSGASGFFFHCLGWEGSDPNTTLMVDRPIWQEVVNEWADWEQQFMFDCFVNGKNKFLYYSRDDDVMWATFTDNKDIYAICLNRNKKTPTTATIPLVDGTGTVKVDGFSAVRMSGEETTLTGSGTLNLELEPMEAAVWRVTPENAIDASTLQTTTYRDMLLGADSTPIDRWNAADNTDTPDGTPDMYQVKIHFESADPSMGTVTPEVDIVTIPGTVSSGTVKAESKATAKTGRRFVNWTYDGKSVGTKVALSHKFAATGGTEYTFVAAFKKGGSGGSGGSGGGGGGGGSTTVMYTLSYESNGGTQFTAEKYSAGTTVTLGKTPEKEGYTFEGWYADKALTSPVEKVTITQNITIYAKWAKEEANAGSGYDTPEILNGEDHFAYVLGYPDGTVKPNAHITRAEVADIFYRLLKAGEVRDKNLTTENAFTDVKQTDWYNTSVSTMTKLGIINGRTAELFAPNENITRAEFAAICARLDDSEFEIVDTFTDVDGHWAASYIHETAARGWIRGYEDNTFKPDQLVTRAEAMAMINRVLNRVPEAVDDLLASMTTWPDNSDTSAWYYLAVQEATNSHTYEMKNHTYEKWTALK